MAQETWVQSPGRVIPKTHKWYLMPPCLTLRIIRYGSRVKWRNPRKGVAPSPTLWCSSYRKGIHRVTLDNGRQLLLTIYINPSTLTRCNTRSILSGIQLV